MIQTEQQKFASDTCLNTSLTSFSSFADSQAPVIHIRSYAPASGSSSNAALAVSKQFAEQSSVGKSVAIPRPYFECVRSATQAWLDFQHSEELSVNTPYAY